MKLNLKLSQKVLLLIMVPLAFELIFVSVLMFSLLRLESEHARAEQMRSASMFFNIELENLIEAMGYLVLFNVLHEPKYMDQFEGSVTKLQTEDAQLKSLAGNEMAADVIALKTVSSDVVASLGDIDKLAHTDDRIDMLRGFMKVKKLLADSNKIGSSFITREAATAQKQQASQKQALQVVIVVIVVGVGMSVMISVWLVAVFNSGAAKQLNAIEENMHLLSSQKELNEPLEGSDELSKIDQTVVQLAQDLQALKAEQQQVYAMITHDLRSPLAAIKVLFHLLSAGALGELNEKGEMRIKNADASITRMVALTNDLLDVEKIASGNFDLRIEKVSMNQLFADALNIVNPRAESQGVYFEAAPTDLFVRCDRERIGRVLVNLLDNAVKFSKRDDIVRLYAVAGSKGVKVAVEDVGRGIAPDQLPLIFERFRQVDRSDETALRGSGLGLAISKGVVEAHDGVMRVESQLGKGSVFSFVLPN